MATLVDGPTNRDAQSINPTWNPISRSARDQTGPSSAACPVRPNNHAACRSLVLLCPALVAALAWQGLPCRPIDCPTTIVIRRRDFHAALLRCAHVGPKKRRREIWGRSETKSVLRAGRPPRRNQRQTSRGSRRLQTRAADSPEGWPRQTPRTFVAGRLPPDEWRSGPEVVSVRAAANGCPDRGSVPPTERSRCIRRSTIAMTRRNPPRQKPTTILWRPHPRRR